MATIAETKPQMIRETFAEIGMTKAQVEAWLRKRGRDMAKCKGKGKGRKK